MKIALAQLNPLIGDPIRNSEYIQSAFLSAIDREVDLILTPELSLLGYPPRDLLLNQELILKQNDALKKLVESISKQNSEISLVVGIAEPTGDEKLPSLFNSIVCINRNGWEVIARKQLLPTYDVFDEKRYFRASKQPGIMSYKKCGKLWSIGFTICEDLWVEEELQKYCLEGPDPIEKLIPHKLDLLINLSASPFSHYKSTLRKNIATQAIKRLNCPLIYLNQVGANDELIFDGGSFVLDSKAELVLELPKFREIITIWDSNSSSKVSKNIQETKTSLEELFEALVLGVRDYAIKCGFKKALLGLSGGIDSALVAVIASAALGKDNINAILMPSPWSSSHSIEDALLVAKQLKISTETIAISDLMKDFESALIPSFGEPLNGITAENLQSRIRGTLLMAFANQKGNLLLSTGNKSELAVGYCTLYGDMNGGLSVIGDVYKTTVFELCRWLDSPASKNCLEKFNLFHEGELIGESIRTKPPSAELGPNQYDSDSLPEYSLLDPILQALIEDRKSLEELVENGYDPELITFVQSLLKKSEFKRRQAPPLLKVTSQSFGSGWRVPIASGMITTISGNSHNK